MFIKIFKKSITGRSKYRKFIQNTTLFTENFKKQKNFIWFIRNYQLIIKIISVIII